MRLDPVESFHAHPLLIDAFAERVREAHPRPDEEIVFTAHSLPQRVVDAGDRYVGEVTATASLVAARAGIERYHRAYQSAGTDARSLDRSGHRRADQAARRPRN